MIKSSNILIESNTIAVEKGAVCKMMVLDNQNNLDKKKEDIEEFAQLLKGLTREEKREVRGIMIGMQINRTSGNNEKVVQ